MRDSSIEEGIILYRGEIPGAIGFDVHGGHGEHWTTDLDHAWRYARGPRGYLKMAILPPSAKRFELVEVDDQDFWDYKWQSVDELQQMSQFPYLRETCEQWAPYEMWCDELTIALLESEYDSLATVGLEGPEEYVLKPECLVQIGRICFDDSPLRYP
jgi:hypothetical protein